MSDGSVDAFELALECADSLMAVFSKSKDDWAERRAELARAFMPAITGHEGETIQ